MKIIFLDIDGVLTIEESNWKEFHPDCLAALKRIIESTDAFMVLSSCWRHGFIDWPTHELMDSKQAIPKIKEWFINAGWSVELANRLFDKTPDFVQTTVNGEFSSGHRGTEISMWLADNSGVESFIILDDDSDMEPHLHRLVHTQEGHEEGLKDADADRAIDLLQKNLDG